MKCCFLLVFFFSCILSEMGHKVTGIDASEGMLSCARDNAGKLNVTPSFFIMDVNSIEFPDDSFDVVISRNVTWTLEHPGEVYAEFKRLLKPGGKLIIYDANWHMHFFDEVLYKKVKKREEDHFKKYGTEEKISGGDMEYLATAPLTSTMRPQWDIKTLKALDMDVDVEEDVGRNVYEEWEKELYAESPLFCVCAVKGERRELTEDMHTYWQERSKTYIFDPENFRQTQDTVRPFLNEGIKRVIDIGTGPAVDTAHGIDFIPVIALRDRLDRAGFRAAGAHNAILGNHIIEFVLHAGNDRRGKGVFHRQFHSPLSSFVYYSNLNSFILFSSPPA